MKILLAPSEAKRVGGDREFRLENLFLPQINWAREEILRAYEETIKEGNIKTLGALFGLKREEDILEVVEEFKSKRVLEAVRRYSGVAFRALDYDSLDKEAKGYIDRNLFIFSNLFGILRARDLILYYKFKQVNPIIESEKIYKEALEILDETFKDEEILDLRAKYYESFYRPAYSMNLKFLKGGKVVSHFAKFYRGLVARECAINNINSFEDLKSLEIPNLYIKEIIEKRKTIEIVYEIEE